MAGLALLGTLAGSAASALAEPGERTAAVVTFLVAASGLSFIGIGAAFWALLAGLLVREVLKGRSKPLNGRNELLSDRSETQGKAAD